MRPLEIVAVVVTAVALLASVLPFLRRARLAVAALGVGASAAPFVVGQGRWQLLAVCAAAILGFARAAWPTATWTRTRLGETGRMVVVAFAFSALALGTASSALMPVTFLPTPTGPYRIGTITFTVVDNSRREIFVAGSTQPRTLPVQIWYPAAEDATGPVEPYLRDSRAFDAVLDYVHAPRFLMSYLTSVGSHAIANAPLMSSHQRLPVVFFVTGNMGYRQSNTVQIEELASHGYVVVAYDPPGTAGSALMPDGSRVPYAGDTVVRPLVNQSIAPVRVAPTLFGTPYPDGIAAYLAADPAAILDQLQTMDAAASGPFAGRLDLTRVGAFDMSLGGFTVSQWCASDPRVKACEIMDAAITVDALARGLSMPALWLTRPAAAMAAEGWTPTDIQQYDGGQHQLFAETRAPAWYVEIGGIKHVDLTDAPYGSPILNWVGMTNDVTGHVHEVMRSVTLAFFDRTILGATGGGPSVLEAVPKTWSDVSVASRP